VKDVRIAVATDPQAAADPFWDHNVEPPICAAVCCGCDVEIFELLISNGADVEANNNEGQTAMMLFRGSQRLHHRYHNEANNVAAIVALLKACGADEAIDEAIDKPIQSSLDMDMETFRFAPCKSAPIQPFLLTDELFLASIYETALSSRQQL